MPALPKFCGKLFFGEETSDHQRSILLVDIMNAIGFSKSEREIHRHSTHLRKILSIIFHIDYTYTYAITGSTAEGLQGGIYHDQGDSDFDIVFTPRIIKLYTPRKNNINNLPLLLLLDNEDYEASFYVDEDVNFPGYVKLSLAEVKANSVYLDYCTRMNKDKLYLSNSMMIGSFCKELLRSSDNYIPSSDSCLKPDINGPAQSVHIKGRSGYDRKMDRVYCIHCDTWPNSQFFS